MPDALHDIRGRPDRQREHAFLDLKVLDSHTSRLRPQLERASDTAYVLNVWGVGYRLVGTAD